MSSDDPDSDVTVVAARKRRKFQKRGHQYSKKKRNSQYPPQIQEFSFEPLLYPPGCSIANEDDYAFDETIENLLPDLLNARVSLQETQLEYDERGAYLRPLTRSEVSTFLASGDSWTQDTTSSLILRKLKLIRERRRGFTTPKCTSVSADHPIRPTPEKTLPNPRVIQALEDIKTTPFGASFLSRLQGTKTSTLSGLIAVDWETITPWMALMSDIRDHYTLAHPGRHQPMMSRAPITYSTLQACHLNQVHDLLERVFWTGIDVSDSLEHSPERCTVVASYDKLVVGVAILSSPQETYITYLAVRAGWDKAQIARNILYHLIRMNPRRDITLHVSANNSAMLLYNQFGFKAEEFIAGFYEDYLDPTSRASKNAFRLRLRQ